MTNKEVVWEMIQRKMIKKRLGKEINAKAILGIHWGTI